MIFKAYGGFVEIEWEEVKEVIKQELNKMSKEKLVQFIMERDGELIELHKEFKDEIVENYVKDCWEEVWETKKL